MTRTLMTGLLALCVLLAAPTASLAQDTGGSFGGSDFGGGGGGGGGGDFGGGGGGGGDWGGGGGGSWDFGSGSSTTGGGGGDLGGSAMGFVLALIVIAAIIAINSARERNRRGASQRRRSDVSALLSTVPPSPQAHVAALQLAIDWRERAAVQAVLERLAASGDLKTRAGLDRLLDETLGELGRRQEAIRLAAYFSESFTSMPACEARFRQVATTERGRFQTEVIRGEAEGALRDDSARAIATEEEGQGFVVVTIIVASRATPPSSMTRLDRSGLAGVANALAANTPETMLALEVVWTPAAEQDRMSSAEMQVLFPHLRSVDPVPAGPPALGRVTCGYCGGVFAAELPRCPQCGADHRAAT